MGVALCQFYIVFTLLPVRLRGEQCNDWEVGAAVTFVKCSRSEIGQ